MALECQDLDFSRKNSLAVDMDDFFPEEREDIPMMSTDKKLWERIYINREEVESISSEREFFEKIYPKILFKDFFGYIEAGEIKTWVGEVFVNYNLLSTWVYMKSLFEIERKLVELEQEALLIISREFSKIDRVDFIYLQKYRDEMQIQILLSIQQYDNKLMDELLDIEYSIRKKYKDLVFEFFYSPADISKKEDFIHPKAQCIYAR